MIQLEDKSHIAVIGGGPAGSFFSIFALKMAKMIGKELNITIFDPKDFEKDGPGGCNRCGGVISELMVETLAVEGINLPDRVVQRGINSYKLYTEHGSAYIETPGHENRIATVYRGGGPKGIIGSDKESFDRFLLQLAVSEGATHESIRVDHIVCQNKKHEIYSKDKKIQETDLVVGCVGVNTTSSKIFEDMGFGYRKPETIVAAMAEIGFDDETMSRYFGSSIHLFLLPLKDINFAAIIPKGQYVSICILGKNINSKTIHNFIEHPIVRKVFPDNFSYEPSCHCLPKMNIKAPKIACTDRVVICGDAGSTRLYKDGIGAAYLMGKAAAKAAVFNGIDKENIKKNYYPVYRSIIIDNMFGNVLFGITDLCRHYELLEKGMLGLIRKEQENIYNSKRLSSILWGMFTGNERYKQIFVKAVNIPLHLRYLKELALNCTGRNS